MRLARLVRRTWDLPPDEFPFLTSIDPYGDTAFNYLMAGRLAAELPRLASRFPGESDISIVLTAACDEVANAAARQLRLVFVGD
jgi:hypothetical protein